MATIKRTSDTYSSQGCQWIQHRIMFTRCVRVSRVLLWSYALNVRNLTEFSELLSIVLVKYDTDFTGWFKLACKWHVQTLEQLNWCRIATNVVYTGWVSTWLDSCSTNSDSLNNLTDNLNSALLKTLDCVTRKGTGMKTPPWFTDDACALKQKCRKLECRWRMTKQEISHLA